jgi:hypothetical protein
MSGPPIGAGLWITDKESSYASPGR